MAGCRAGLVLALAVVVGCTSTPPEIFDAEPLHWPLSVEAPRIRLVGELRSSDDLGAQPTMGQRLAHLFGGPDEPQALFAPRGILSLPERGELWVADPSGPCLHRFGLEDREYLRVVEVAGTPLVSPVAVCRGPGNVLYVADSGAGRVLTLDLSEGLEGELLATPESLERPVGLAFSVDRAELFVVDGRAHDIKVLDPDGKLLRILGRRGAGLGEFNFPCDLVDGGDRLWLADTGNSRLQALSYEGEALATIGGAGDAPGDTAMPKGVALDSRGHVYVVDARYENIQVFDLEGRLLLHFGQEGQGPGEFWLPSGISIDRNDRIWVCDTHNGRIQVFDYLRNAENDNE